MSPQLRMGLQPAPKFVFIYTAAGITGSVLALIQITVLIGVFVSQGLKSRSLQYLCPVAVHFQYYSGFLQLLSMFNHIGYINEFFQRLGDRYPADSNLQSAAILGQMALGPILPVIMMFCIYQTKKMCYNNLKKMISGAVIQKHIFLAIGTCQFLSSFLVIAFCGANLMQFLDQLSVSDAVLNGDAFGAYLVNWTYFVYPCLGLIGLMLGLFYLYVTGQMNTYEIEALGLDDTKEASMLAGQRVSLQKGTSCIVRHIVDKPGLNGQRGTIEMTGTDEEGRVSVNVGGQEYKLEEYQCEVTTSVSELEKVKMRAKLKTAELLYNWERKGFSLKAKQIVYVTAGQVICGLLVFFILSALIQANFNAASVFHEISISIPANYEYANLTTAQASAKETQVLQIQERLCQFWSQCFEGAPPNRVCGGCVVPKPVDMQISSLQRPTFIENNLLAGDSFTAIIASSAIGVALGVFFVFCFVVGVAKLGCCATIITAVPVLILFAIIGLAVAPLPHELSTYLPFDKTRCNDRDLDPAVVGVQRVSPLCLQVTAAYSIQKAFTMDARLSVTGCLVNMFWYLFESLFNLAVAIRATGPVQWAKFEVLVFMWYFIFVAVCLLGGNLVSDFTDMFARLFALYSERLQSAQSASDYFGESFPLYYKQYWNFVRQEALSKDFWYNASITMPTLAIALILQVCGIISSFFHEVVWVRTMRVVLLIDALICLTLYSAMTYLTFISVNLAHNFVTVLLIPLTVQLLFALQYSLQSEILPIFDMLPANPVLAVFTAAFYVSPFVAGGGFSIGFAYWLFYVSGSEQMQIIEAISGVEPPLPRESAASTAVTIMAVCGSVIALFLLVVVCGGAQQIYVYYDDWVQMAADLLSAKYPGVFGTPTGEEDDAIDAKEMQHFVDMESAQAEADAEAVEDEAVEEAASK